MYDEGHVVKCRAAVGRIPQGEVRGPFRGMGGGGGGRASFEQGGEGGRGFWTENLVYQKWPDQIFPIVNFVFSRYGHFGLGRGGGGFGGGVPPPPLVFNYSKEALGGEGIKAQWVCPVVLPVLDCGVRGRASGLWAVDAWRCGVCAARCTRAVVGWGMPSGRREYAWVLRGVRICSRYEEGILQLWMGVGGCLPLGWGG